MVRLQLLFEMLYELAISPEPKPSSSNFNRQFRKLCGLPPSEYRRQTRRNMCKSTVLYRLDGDAMRVA